MAKNQPVKAFKIKGIDNPVTCVPVPVTAFYAMSGVVDNNTVDGPMVLAVKRKTNELYSPDLEIAMLLGRVDTGRNTVSGPEVFYWRDKCWMQAVDKLNLIYYRQKANAFYEVNVTNFEELFANANNPFIDAMKK